MKSTGKETVYHYYRCSNSRKIHPKKEHVTEDKIWQQFEPAIDDLTISEEFAKLIADALNETQEKQRAAIKKQMEGFKMELKTLDAREDSAYLDYSKGVLDEAGYRRQVKRMRAERDDYTEQLERLNLAISDAGMSSVKEVIELAINARSLWKGMNREERLEYLKRVCSNQTLDGLTVRYQLEKPFARLASWKQNEGWRREWDSLAPHASDREK